MCGWRVYSKRLPIWRVFDLFNLLTPTPSTTLENKMISVLFFCLATASWSGLPDADTTDFKRIDSKVQIDEWQVPWAQSRPRDPYVGPEGRVWFVGQRSDYAAVFDPSSEEFERFDLESGAGPHNLIVDDRGIVWYAGNRAAHIGRLDPATGAIKKIPMPDPAVRDPHTLVFDSHGDIWFSVQGGNFVGKLDMSDESVIVIPVPTSGSRPYGIVVDQNDRPWFTEFGSNKLGTVDPKTMELAEIVLPRDSARPRRLDVDSGGRIWYVDYADGKLGMYDPGTKEIREWDAPSGSDSRPYAMAMDSDDRVWFVETGPDPNQFVGFDIAAEEFFSVTEIGSGGGTVRHMYFHPPGNEIWFGTDANTLGRARLP